MTKLSTAAQVSLWLFVLSAGILTGGSIFEHAVVTPLWAGSLPESVMQWPYGGIQGRFFMVASPLYGFFSLALAGLFWSMPRRQQRWALTAGVSGILVVLATLFFFLPILEQTQSTRGAGLSGEEITRLVNQFRSWHWLRLTAMLIGWIAGLRALSLSAGVEVGEVD